MVCRVALFLVSCCLLADGVSSQVPQPKDWFGYELGERYTAHASVVSWVKEVARQSPRVTVQKYGETNEGRPLLLLFVTSEKNHARIGALRERMGQLADPRTLGPDSDVDNLVADLPVFVWLSYNVHGNETSCTTAAMRTLQELTSDADGISGLLDDCVVIMDPCLNPDGRDRYVNWFNSVVGMKGDPNHQSLEHDEPWPGGRFNHYYFDLNRDWAFMTQVETRARIREYVRWNPQVHVDFHEMGRESSYFFFPADKPVNDNYPPHTTKWGEIFGRGNAGAFDARGWDYYTGESFDLFYPGYGDSWPSLHGAIGMTYEQAGGSSAGVVVRNRDKRILGLRDRMEHHFVSGMATIRTAVSNRDALLREFHQFRASAIEEGRGGSVREFILVPGDDIERTGRLVNLLRAQGVQVRRATSEFKVRDVTDYGGNQLAEKSFAAGSYLVSLAQPTKRLIKTLLEPRTRIKELFFYDIAAWSLPLSFGVEAFWTHQSVDAATEPVTSVGTPPGGIDEGQMGYGYLLRWDTMASVRAVIRMLRENLVLKSAHKPFTLDGRSWGRGTIVIPKGGNPADLSGILGSVSKSCGVRFVPASTGMTEKGIDLGSDRMLRIKPPRIALLADDGVRSTSYGATRFVVEALYDIPYSSFRLSALAGLDLDEYSSVVIPSGRISLDEKAREKLAEFARGGGVVVACASAVRALTKEQGGLTSISTGTKKKEGEKKEEKKEKPQTIEEKEKDRRRRATPGSIFRVSLDPAHPLAFGYGDEIAVFQSGMLSFDPDAGGIAVGRFVDAPPLAGYILAESEEKMRGRGYVMVEKKGRGGFVLFAGDPNFRSAWHGLSRLFLNAVILVPKM